MNWQMDLGPIWIVQQYRDSDYNPADVTSTTKTVVSGGTAGSSQIEISGADAIFGNYASDLAWSMVTNNDEVLYVESVSGDTINLKKKLLRDATTVVYRSIVIWDVDRTAKIYGSFLDEDFKADITPDSTGLGPDKIGRHILNWQWTALLGLKTEAVIPIKVPNSDYWYGGGIEINGTTLTQGVDFDISDKLPGAARDEIVSAINGGIPDVTAYSEGSYNIGISGRIRHLTCDLHWKICSTCVQNPIYIYDTDGCPPVFNSKNLKVNKTMTLRGHLVTDNRRRARTYRNTLWNLTRCGWVDVYVGNTRYQWYIVRKVDISVDFNSQVDSPQSLPHKIIVYNFVSGLSIPDYIKVNGTTLTAGVDFNAVVSNAVTATNMAAAITSNISGVTASSPSGSNEVILAGTVTQLSTPQGVTELYDWCTIVGGGDRSYKYDVTIELEFAPPADHKVYWETE